MGKLRTRNLRVKRRNPMYLHKTPKAAGMTKFGDWFTFGAIGKKYRCVGYMSGKRYGHFVYGQNYGKRVGFYELQIGDNQYAG